MENNITYCTDADDFCMDNNGLDILFRIKGMNPDFKITLFTIVGRCTRKFLDEIKKLNWINMVPHGWMHETSRECENWTYERMSQYLDAIEDLELEKGFKAPGWQIDKDGNIYRALIERGYWVADQAYNDDRRPRELRVYILDSPNKLHYHIGHLGGRNENEIGQFADYLANLRGTFQFIKDVI